MCDLIAVFSTLKSRACEQIDGQFGVNYCKKMFKIFTAKARSDFFYWLIIK